MSPLKSGGSSVLDNKEKIKKMVKIVIILLVLLVIANIALIVSVYYMDLQTFKVSFDGQPMKEFPDDLFVFEESGDIYVKIKDFSSLVKYKMQRGGYKEYSENPDECYIENDNEVAEFSLGSNMVTKYNKYTKIYEFFEVDKPIKKINEDLYASIEGISIGANVRFSYDKEKNKLDVYTLAAYVTAQISNFGARAAISGAELSPEEQLSLFNNQKAVLYNLVVVKDVDNNRIGVCDTAGREIIGTKYKSIEFVESSQDFIVQTEEGKFGIFSKDGSPKIKPEYDSIKQMDSKQGLYIIKIGNKEGVVNKDGKTIVYPESDNIGIEDISVFPTLKNQYLLYDNYIPVIKNKKWGWYDINGKKVVDTLYSNLGCRNNYTTEITGEPVLLIPDYEAIVVGFYEKNAEGKDNVEKYAILKMDGTPLINKTIDKVLSVVNSGKRQYYMIIGDDELDVEQYLTDSGIPKVE